MEELPRLYVKLRFTLYSSLYLVLYLLFNVYMLAKCLLFWYSLLYSSPQQTEQV